MQEKSGGAVTANLITGLNIDEFFQRTDGVGSRALLTDALGSTVALGDGTGTLQTQYTYEPFGYATQTGQSSINSYKYTSREDDGSGLYYYRARYYHPRLQRFLAEDPIGFRAGDTNLYAYAWQNPLTYVDPSGNNAALTMAAGGAIGGLPGAAVGLAIGVLGGYIVADPLRELIFNKPPDNAYDPDGRKAPGKPTADDGFVGPAEGDVWAKAPDGRWGWQDKSGDVWCPTGKAPGRAHGGPHWDVQSKRRPHRNMYPGGRERP